MRLARIEHWKCGEPMYWRGGGGYTYVWVPDEMEGAELDVFCERAQKAYLDAEREFKAAEPAGAPGYGVYGATIMPNTPDTMTVGELKAEYAAKAEAFKKHQELTAKARKPFAWHLKEVTNGAIAEFWQIRPEGFLEAKVDWGHNHNVTIEHSPTVMGDYPFPEGEEDDL